MEDKKDRGNPSKKQTPAEKPVATNEQIIAALNAKHGKDGWEGVVVDFNGGQILVAVGAPPFNALGHLCELILGAKLSDKGQSLSMDKMVEVIKPALLLHDETQFDQIAQAKPIIVPRLFEKVSKLAAMGVSDAKKDA